MYSMTGQKPSSLIADTFEPLEVLYAGGLGQVFLVKGCRGAPGYKTFLANTLAWQETIQQTDVETARQELFDLNTRLQDLLDAEYDWADDGRGDRAKQMRRWIKSINKELRRVSRQISSLMRSGITDAVKKTMRDKPEHLIDRILDAGLDYPDDELFAAKVISGRNKEGAARLRDEFYALKMVMHPHILNAYNTGPGYYIMEYLDDIHTAEAFCGPSGNGGYSLKDQVNVIIDVAAALEHAHSYGVIHRDIKPENIAVNSDYQATLIDFGLVKSVFSKGLTENGITLGTPNFMSPCQIKDVKEARVHFDIYGLGAALYTYVTGERPYLRARHLPTDRVERSSSAQGVFRMVFDPLYKPIPPVEIIPGLPQALEDIIVKAMATETIVRYQNMREFRRDLERFRAIYLEGKNFKPVRKR